MRDIPKGVFLIFCLDILHTLTYYDITFLTEGEGHFVIGHQTYNAVSRDVFFRGREKSAVGRLIV